MIPDSPLAGHSMRCRNGSHDVFLALDPDILVLTLIFKTAVLRCRK